MRRLVTLIVLLTGLWFAHARVPAALATSTDAREFADLLLADIVLRGRVESVSREMVSPREYDPGYVNDDGGYFELLMVHFRVEEVLRGYWSDSTITFVVNMSNSLRAGRWNAGDEVVVPLAYLADFRGGYFEVSSDAGRFVRKGTAWNAQGAYLQCSLEEIRAVLRPSALDAVAMRAGRIVVGMVTDIEEAMIVDPQNAKRVSRVWIVTLRPEDILKGPRDSSLVTFRVFRGGVYWPSWAFAGPRSLQRGARYCVFLEGDGDVLDVTHGANGIFGVSDDTTLTRGSLSLPTNIGDVRELLE